MSRKGSNRGTDIHKWKRKQRGNGSYALLLVGAMGVRGKASIACMQGRAQSKILTLISIKTVHAIPQAWLPVLPG
eukprot:scaffold185766_cov21-Tisochrysis_lutea.AAC.1